MRRLRLPRAEQLAAVRRNLRAIWPFLGRRRRALAALVVLGFVTSAAEGVTVGLVVALLYRLLGASTGGGYGGMPPALASILLGMSAPSLSGVIIVLLLARASVAGLYNLLASHVSAAVAHEVRAALYDRFVHVEYDYVARRGIGSLLNTLEWESQAVPDAVQQLAAVAMDLMALTVYGILLLVMSWRLALLAVALGLALFPLLIWISASLNRRSEALRSSYERVSEVTVATIQALRTVKLLGAEAETAEMQRVASGNLARSSFAIALQQAYTEPKRQIALLATAGLYLALLRSSGLPQETTLTVVAVLYRMMPHVTAMERQAMNFSRNIAPLQSTFRALQLPERRRPGRPGPPFDGDFAQIGFAGVGFQYQASSEPSLVDVHLTFHRGSFTAVTGPSGGGKTTLINLLARLHDPSCGEIRVDGHRLSEIPPDVWLRTVAFAGQDVELLSGSILDNLLLGNRTLAVEEAWDALTIAQAAGFVRQLEHGLNTEVGDRGTNLSGGQRQRLVLARALARRPRLLVLDEATNAVDPAMEREIYRTIRLARPDLTLVVVTHRGDTSMADSTVTLDLGRVRSVSARPAADPLTAEATS